MNIIQYTFNDDLPTVNSVSGLPNANARGNNYGGQNPIDAHSGVITGYEVLDQIFEFDKSQDIFITKGSSVK